MAGACMTGILLDSCDPHEYVITASITLVTRSVQWSSGFGFSVCSWYGMQAQGRVSRCLRPATE